MIRVHSTKKLLTKLPIDERGRIIQTHPGTDAANDGQDTLLSGWHANLIILQGRNCVLMAHDATRFPVFIPCLKKADFAHLDHLFIDIFMNTLLKAGATDAQMQIAHNALAPLVLDSQCDRSVQGTMNQMAQDLGHSLWYNNAKVADLLPYSTSLWLADRPCTAKGVKDCIWPIRAMLALLDKASPPE
ncbi:DUF6933 domain-containing protein [Marinimicrobium alkaliphilum]|uniref:DUF6933 domain-containing protein n=1 Tax=Marinimicrobium alkaliphilum TaxID=2202654 RepID=UPI000DB9495B|nr:hypothetical protein [Marinimicrobium alkaliphilum]